jgi:hypothetical protein
MMSYLTCVKVLNDEQVIMNQRFQNRGLTGGGSLNLAPVEQELLDLKTKVTALESALATQLAGVQNSGFSGSGELANIKIQLKLLEARLPTHNVLKLGGFIFQSRSDVALFVESKTPSNAFCMFHDVVTLMERLSGNYVECKEVINKWYQATKVGLDEREARHVSSFKITYPTVFGYVKEGTMNVKNHLPAVKSFKEWNSFDAESGVKSFILNGMEDLKLQLYQDISNSFSTDQFYDARLLANDMYSKSQVFVAEMANWMDVFSQELLTTLEATEEEAWELVSACIKHVFEDLRRVRASAANATSELDPSSKSATILWALIQSHKVMKDFLDMRFRNHPFIAPVIVLHVFKTRVTRTPVFKNPKPNPKDAEGDKVKGGKN